MPGMDAKIRRRIDDEGRDYYRRSCPNEIGTLFVRVPLLSRPQSEPRSTGGKIFNGTYRDDLWLNTGDLFPLRRRQDGFAIFRSRKGIDQTRRILFIPFRNRENCAPAFDRRW